MVTRNYSNIAVDDTLAVSGGGNLSTGATSIYAASGAPAGYPTPPFSLTLEPATSNFEMVLVNSGAGTSGSPWIITRSIDGTTARTHSAGTVIRHTMSAADLTGAQTHYATGSAGAIVHGLPAAAWLAGTFQNFASTTTTASQGSFTWSSIPQTSKHLLIVAQGRLAETTVLSDDVSVQFNGDSGAHYSYLTQYGLSSTTPSPLMNTGYALTSAPLFRFLAGLGGVTANVGGGFALFPNYTSSSFNAMGYAVSGGGDGTSSFFDMRTRLVCWNPAAQAAITSISLIPPTGGFNINCYFSLHGIG